MLRDVKRLVAGAHKARRNRAFHEKYFENTAARKAGLVQGPEFEGRQLDLVELADAQRNELLYLFGFHHANASHFEFTLSLVGLCPGGARAPASKWRLARASLQLVLVDPSDELKLTRYTYECEQLLDYEPKRRAHSAGVHKYEDTNIYKLGALSLEIVQPFALSRVLFNGPALVETSCTADACARPEWRTVARSAPIRLSLSAHPTCDKFDYQYQFDVKQLARAISESLLNGADEAASLLALALEDRLDQPLMFEGQLERLDRDEGEREGGGAGGENEQGQGQDKRDDAHQAPFFMWGGKVKKFTRAHEWAVAREHLFAWTECGQQVHLTRPTAHPRLVYGFAHAGYDYASPLGAVSLVSARPDGAKLELDELTSFGELSHEHALLVRAFRKKDFRLELDGERTEPSPPLGLLASRPIRINGFAGRAVCPRLNLGAQFERAQQKLLVLALRDHLFAHTFAEERLLGGKALSLVRLSRLVHHDKRLARFPLAEMGASAPNLDLDLSPDTAGPAAAARVSVPRGLVVTTRAFELWLAGDPEIASALRELDAARRTLAARPARHLDPLVHSNHLSGASAQAQLRALCEATRAKLLARPLPAVLVRLVRASLCDTFGGAGALSETEGCPLAVRSSCVGEDSLETSAAGQMKTLLGVRGLQAVLRAIVDCWLSQFGLEALTYKSQNGLSFALPMAVVVQELVACRTAGVAATCDPLTGNKSRLEITANAGLGEGVVAGRATDTVRVLLPERPGGPLRVRKLNATNCCLDNVQIAALARVLLELRALSPNIEELEVEWGLTLAEPTGGRFSGLNSSGSSSSSHTSQSSDSSGSLGLLGSRAPALRIHLFQSRPLTHLQRLSAREIIHELDYGLQCPRDLTCRANVGEVMPGAMCPLHVSWLGPIMSSYLMRKPYDEGHTRCPFAADNTAFHAQMVHSVLTYSDSAQRFAFSNSKANQRAHAIMYSMMGTTLDEIADERERREFQRLCEEKVDPLKPDMNISMGLVLAIDLAIFPTLELVTKRKLHAWSLTGDLIALETLCERVMASGADSAAAASATNSLVSQQICQLHERLVGENRLLAMAWMCHILGSVSSIASNVIAMKMLSEQPGRKGGLAPTKGAAAAASADPEVAAPESEPASEPAPGAGSPLASPEVLSDLVVLMRDTRGTDGRARRKRTESGDISRLLDQLLESMADHGQLEYARTLSERQLYEFLSAPATDGAGGSGSGSGAPECSRLFCDFMARNGHRAWKEFCMSTHTWADRPSAVVKPLASRLRSYTREQPQLERARRDAQEREHQLKLARVLEGIQTKRWALLEWVIPRARNNAIRRERTKSTLIRVVHSYRLAFRHLGGLLCLAGVLPDAELIFQLTINELNEVVSRCCQAEASGPSALAEPSARDQLMPRLLYKARRRQQCARQVNKITMPRPTLPVMEMIQVIEEQTGEQRASSHEPERGLGVPLVRGLISCAGMVTGRACVLDSLDEADQIEPDDILITYSIDISWSVYFHSLAGIVTEVGGIVSHGAVVAREYGLPTLCTAVGACSLFKTGQLVTLDATNGICYLAGKQPK